MNIFDRIHRWSSGIIAGTAGTAAGFLGFIMSDSFPLLATIALFGLVFVCSLLFVNRIDYRVRSLSESIHQQFFQLAKNVLETEDELRSMINIRPLMGDSVMPFDGWSVDGLFAARLIHILEQVRPELVVECGSGTSTVLAARYLKETESGRILALEHKEKFAASTSRHLRQHQLDDVATVIEAPLREYNINGESRVWYDFNPENYLGQSIDLLIVDGPPGNTGPLARYPAVPLLKNWLSTDCVILLDDGNREDEQEIAEKWVQKLDAVSEFHPKGKGIWVIRNGIWATQKSSNE